MIVFLFLLFFSISFHPSPVFAQVHPGLENFNLSLKNEAEVLFARGRYKEAIERYKEVLKSEGETSYIFRTMLKAWKAMDDLKWCRKVFKKLPGVSFHSCLVCVRIFILP